MFGFFKAVFSLAKPVGCIVLQNACNLDHSFYLWHFDQGGQGM